MSLGVHLSLFNDNICPILARYNSDKMHLLKIQYIIPIQRIVFAFCVVIAFITFNGCKQTEPCLNITRCEMLDSIEAQMFQRPERLDSLLVKIDTTNITPYEQARIGTIRGLSKFENGEYDQSIKELEKAENFFFNQHDHYHLHITKLIKAFTFEYLNLDHNAASLYGECENYFNTNHQDKYKFFATLGLFRMANQLKLDEKVLLDRLKKAALQFNDPNYDGLLYATMGVFEKNDSLKSIYYEYAKSELISGHRWSRVYAIELNSLFVKIRKDPSDNTQIYYDNFPNKVTIYIPTVYQKMRYKYAQAYLFSKQGKNKLSIAVATQVLKEAMALNIINVETDCVQLLAYLYKLTCDFKNAHSMLEKYHLLQKKEMDALQQNRLLALGAHYRYSELKREKSELKLKAQKYLLISVVISLITMLVISIIWISLKKSNYNQEILKLKNIEIEEQISNLLQTLQKDENKNEELIRKTEDIKDHYADTIKVKIFLDEIEQNQITKWGDYEKYFNELRPGWIEKLKLTVPGLTKIDLRYCMCIYFNLNNVTIMNLNNVGIEAVKSGKKRIRNKFSLDDSKKIYTFLNDFN